MLELSRASPAYLPESARLRLVLCWPSKWRAVPPPSTPQDIAGLVKGASKGEGLGNQFLANIRECDSIVQVRVRPAAAQVGWWPRAGSSWPTTAGATASYRCVCAGSRGH